MIILLAVSGILIMLYEGIPLLRKKLWRELVTVGILIASAIFLGIAEMLGVTMPIPWLEQLVGPLGQTIFK